MSAHPRQGHGEDLIERRLRATPIRIGKEPDRASDGFEQRPASSDHVPLMTLVIEAEDTDSARHSGDTVAKLWIWVRSRVPGNLISALSHGPIRSLKLPSFAFSRAHYGPNRI